MRAFTGKAIAWLVAGLAFVVAPIIYFDIETGLLVGLSIAATLFLGFSNMSVIFSPFVVYFIAVCLELATQERFWILEVMILMVGGFFMTLVGGQIRRALHTTPYPVALTLSSKP